jgi:uncharacterized protein (DUF427 family)
MTNPIHIRIWHRPSGTLLVEGPKGWGITPFEGNYYIRKMYLMGDFFRSTLIPGLCPYKGIYHWLNLDLPDGQREDMLGWRYIIPNPLFPFIAFRLGLPGNHPALRYEMASAVQLK